jgi:2,3-dihydroxybenzoate decarboxylase
LYSFPHCTPAFKLSQEAEDNATLAGDWVANKVKKHPDAFCTLSMHNPQQAANELVRCIKELGMLRALIDGHQSTGPDGEGLIFYDGPEWDIFWTKVEELDVPCE